MNEHHSQSQLNFSNFEKRFDRCYLTIKQY